MTVSGAFTSLGLWSGIDNSGGNNTRLYQFTTPGTYTLPVTTGAGGGLWFDDNTTGAIVSAVSFKQILGYTNFLNGFQAGNYLESTGNTNASIDGAVGLVLDAAGSVGAELITTRDCSTAIVGAPGSLPTGWQGITPNQGVSRSVVAKTDSYVDIRLQGTATSTFCDFVQGYFAAPMAVAGGDRYQIQNQTAVVVAGSLPSGGNIAYSVVYQNSGTYVSQEIAQNLIATVPATGVNQMRQAIVLSGYSSGAVIDVTIRCYPASCKKVTGIHASQATTANKPILRRGILNLLLQNGDFTNAAWTRTNVNNLGNVQAPDGTNTASNLNFVFVSPITRLYQDIALQSANGTRYTFAVWLRSATPCKVSIGVQRSGPADQEQAEVDVTATWQLFTFTHSGAFTGTSAVRGVIFSYDAAFNRNIEVWRPGLFQGTLTAQQILAAGGIPLTTTAPASSQYGPYAWQFDGSNDVLALPGPLFQMADDHCVVAAVSKNSVDTSSPGIFAVEGDTTSLIGLTFSSAKVQYFLNAGGASAYRVSSADYQSTPTVISGRKLGTSAVLRVNGVQQGAVLSTAAVGTSTMTSASIGKHAYGGVAAPLNGLIYPIIAIKGTVSDAELKVLEKWLGSIAGVAIA